MLNHFQFFFGRAKKKIIPYIKFFILFMATVILSVSVGRFSVSRLRDFIVRVYTSQDFAQTQQSFAQLHDCTKVTFRNSSSNGEGCFENWEEKDHWLTDWIIESVMTVFVEQPSLH